MADLDLRIREIVRGYKYKKEEEKEQRIDLCTMPHCTMRSISTFKN